MHGGVRTSSSVSQSSSLWLECAGFTGGSAATSCDDMMRAALILIGPHLHTPRPAAAAACCALRCLSTTLCLMRAMIATRFTALGVIPILGNRGRVANSVTLTELSQMF